MNVNAAVVSADKALKVTLTAFNRKEEKAG